MRLIYLLPFVAAFAAGCGPDCQSSCERLYGDGPESCDLQVPGATSDDMFSECLAHCNNAMARNGEVGAYNPNERAIGGEVTLDNEKQAALWMDCVAETACGSPVVDGQNSVPGLSTGICAPTMNFP